MKLDRDCVRDLLLFVESLDHGQVVQSDDLGNIPALASHSAETITYTVEKLDEAGFLNVKFMRVLGGEDPFFIKSITWDGHQFLDNIRDDGIWKETKKVTSKIASVSVGILADVAASVMKKTLGID